MLEEIRTYLIGAVEYTISAEEEGVVNARYISSGSEMAAPGIVCRGRAVGDTSTGFAGEHDIEYFDAQGNLAGQYRWIVARDGDVYRIQWLAKSDADPLARKAGDVVFEGFGFANTERSLVAAYWFAPGVSELLNARAAAATVN